MARALAALALCAVLAACAPPREGCGLIGCISSPYLQARGQGLIGADVGTAIGIISGAPDSTYAVDGRTQVLTWTRRQNDRSTGLLVCSETLTVRDQRVVDYSRRGNCGG